MKYLLIAILFLCSVCNTYAAFPVKLSHPSAAGAKHYTLATGNGTIINYGDTIARRTTYGYQHHKPYHNREREAKLAFTFGLLGILAFAPFGVAAFILGVIAADRRNKYYDKAKTGIVLGAVSIFLLIIIIAVSIASI